MSANTQAGASKRFKEYLEEISQTYYDGDLRKAFRHAAFQQTAPDPSLSDRQVIELTAIDKSGDLEVDGWFCDDNMETFFLFQAVGGENRADEASVMKFWQAPDLVLDPERVAATRNASVRELSRILNEKLRGDYGLLLVFAAKAGFTPSAINFAKNKSKSERSITLLDGTRVTIVSSLELVSERDVATKFEEYRAGLRGTSVDVDLGINEIWSHTIDQYGIKSLRITLKASEIVRVFRMSGVRFRLFLLNPRGPIANARVNKNIATTLATPEGRNVFHLLNNGLCATCNSFTISGGRLKAKNFQIVNGCQTTVTLDSRSDDELEQTLVDVKLAVADVALSERIATASNSQTALRAKDYASFERQQRLLQTEFGNLQPPWYYEIKQGYWRYVLTDPEKARFKTGQRKRHIEVQPLAQASLAFTGYPADALDRVRFVFQGIRTEQDREWYERAFPVDVRAEQMLVPWLMLDFIERQESRQKFSSFHIVWVISRKLKEFYSLNETAFSSAKISNKLVSTIQSWLPPLFRVANRACGLAVKRASFVTGNTIEPRDFYRASKELGPGMLPTELILEAFREEVGREQEEGRDPLASLAS